MKFSILIDFDECKRVQCRNGGSCVDLYGEARCHCPKQFKYPYCSKSKLKVFVWEMRWPVSLCQIGDMVRCVFKPTVWQFLHFFYQNAYISYYSKDPAWPHKTIINFKHVLSCVDSIWKWLVIQTVQIKTEVSLKIKIDCNCNFVGLFHHPVWFYLDLALLGHHFFNF